MNYISEIRKVFSQPNIEISERIKCVDIHFDTKFLPEYDSLNKLISSFPSRDNVRITLTDITDETIVLGNRNYISSKETYGSYRSKIDSNETIDVKISIEKEIQKNIISIYCYNSFSEDLCSLSLFDVMRTFTYLLNDLEQLNFVVFDETCSFITKTMNFSSEEGSVFSTDISRLKRIQECNDVSRFYCAQKLNLIPDDFKIVVDMPDNPLTSLFEKIYTLLSLAFISTTSSIDNEKLFIQVSGQRSVSYEIDIKAIQKNENLYNIYNWIFTDGNPTDKAIIARNVISLHCRYTNLIEIDNLAFASIQSNYSLYLRQNVSQYLELKNKVAEYICEVVAKTGDYATTIFDRFKQNLIALMGFFLTTILANLVSSNPIDKIFTKDITMILYSVLVGSVLFLVISILETHYKVKTIKRSYDFLQENYKKTLSDADIKEIFNDDKVFNYVKTEIRCKTALFAVIWIAVIVALFFLVEYLSTTPLLINHIP